MTLPALLLAFALSPVAEYRLRNVAATDAAQAVSTFAAQQKLDVTVTAEPVSNTVRVVGDAAGRQRVGTLLTDLDRQPRQFYVRMLFVRVPVGFAARVGLTDGDETGWVLTPRETRLLTAAIRRDAAAGIMSRPTLTVVDNQTGFFQVGDAAGDLLVVRATPRLAPDGASALLRLETQVAHQRAGGDLTSGRDIQTVQTTASLPLGNTLVVRGSGCTSAKGVVTEVFALATVERLDLTSER